MIIPSKDILNFSDDYFQEIINPDFEKIDSPFQQTSSLKPYVSNVILEKIIIDLEDEVVSLLEKEKASLKTIESLKSKGFESSENAIFESENQSENDCHVVEKKCDKVENSKVIAPGLFKLSVSQSVSPISMSKTSCDSKNVESKLKKKKTTIIWFFISSKSSSININNKMVLYLVPDDVPTVPVPAILAPHWDDVIVISSNEEYSSDDEKYVHGFNTYLWLSLDHLKRHNLQ
uniref:Uncharacterized protein n=1 Tax=Tanacetum cinerariifolium TaxID=118510 RepID=A0A6L2KU63_TANCI|nr:hypothetical protein [Tanacetum cinerariifolium]